jgi:hypothetical protein
VKLLHAIGVLNSAYRSVMDILDAFGHHQNVTVGSTVCSKDIAIKLNILLIGFGFTSHV